ncbi:hypothetical protein Egran_00216 [Elaphomyces granulatus]|uniref:HIT-type domain-containing protein n=1 Tax=Elaphomyces granulatus TaxID=519963 RepID=A0A232M6N5_9EURO|nr:hypothetical protein Egran_00216 [Elaphomyces granulatus]
MFGDCEVCSSQPSKYKCPTCGTLSCSLSCTQSHKTSCAPKATSASDQDNPPASSEAAHQHQLVGGEASDEKNDGKHRVIGLEDLGSSKELEDIFTQYTGLRQQLRDIYKATLEEGWVDSQVFDGARGFGRRRGVYKRSGSGHRGVWTAEKGFKRGLARVRQWRERCEDGLSTGPDAEGFVEFVALVTGERPPVP